MKKRQKNRRSFLKKLGLSAAAFAGFPSISGASNKSREVRWIKTEPSPRRKIASNDRLRIACIGTGGMGMGDTDTALKVGGVEVVAACDLYDGRLTRAKEKWGKDLFTTKDYREILARKDIDVIICGTTDHWHEKISVAAMQSGKAVYCEKPMTQTVEEGHRVIKAQDETGQVFQVGSQYRSSLLYAKAKELLAAGEIGTLNFCEAVIDRHSFRGAWQYSIPLDASPETVDWDTYVKHTTKRPFDAKRFFRWRNYQDYGTGIAGDLFVHMLTTFHTITGSLGPTSIVSKGGLHYFNDGREVPDLQIGLYDYPETEAHPAFNLSMRVNFADGSGGRFMIRLVGDEGEIRIERNVLTLSRNPWPSRPRTSLGSFSEAGKKAFMEWYDKKYPETFEVEGPRSLEYRLPENYQGDRYMHFCNFFASIRDGAPLIEDARFGLRAAGPTFAGNKSYQEGMIVGWDPVGMVIR